MITDDDVIKLSRVFATKLDVEDAKQEVLDSNNKKADRILEAIDSFAGEIKDHRMKEIVHRQEHADTIERLDKIEKVPAIAHSLKS